MQYRMRGKTYELPTSLDDTDTYELDRIQWLAQRASFNPDLQMVARALLKKGTHIHTLDRGEYIVVDDYYNVQQADEYYHDVAMDDEVPPVPEETAQSEQEDPVESPTVAINIQGERYWLAYGGVSSISSWEQYRREHRARQSLPTTEEVMFWDLRVCGARKQADASWSLPSWMTLQMVEESMHFDVVGVQPIPPEKDPLIDGHEQYRKQFPIISGY